LAKAELSVHLVGSKFGMVPEDERRSNVSQQFRLAVEGGALSGSCLVWIPPGLTTENERQREFIEYLRTDPHGWRGDKADLLRTTLDALKATIESKIKAVLDRRQRLERPRAKLANDDSLDMVYLICDRQDRGAVAPLRTYLRDQGCQVMLPATEGNEAAIRMDHTEKLRVCDAALIYCGRASDTWLFAQLQALRKAPGYGRTEPMAARAIYLGPPDASWKQEFETPRSLSAIKGVEGFSPESLAPILGQLRRGGGGGQ
jgi:hypothetical protein